MLPLIVAIGFGFLNLDGQDRPWLIFSVMGGLFVILTYLGFKSLRKITVLQVRALLKRQIVCLALLLGGMCLFYAFESTAYMQEIVTIVPVLVILLVGLDTMTGFGLLFFRRHRKAGAQLFLVGLMAVWWFQLQDIKLGPERFAPQPASETASQPAATQPASELTTQPDSQVIENSPELPLPNRTPKRSHDGIN